MQTAEVVRRRCCFRNVRVGAMPTFGFNKVIVQNNLPVAELLNRAAAHCFRCMVIRSVGPRHWYRANGVDAGYLVRHRRLERRWRSLVER
jgi:hypothetical protein